MFEAITIGLAGGGSENSKYSPWIGLIVMFVFIALIIGTSIILNRIERMNHEGFWTFIIVASIVFLFCITCIIVEKLVF